MWRSSFPVLVRYSTCCSPNPGHDVTKCRRIIDMEFRIKGRIKQSCYQPTLTPPPQTEPVHVIFTRVTLCQRGYYSYGPVPASVTSQEFYRNRWTNRAGFWRGSFLSPILYIVIRKFWYLPKYGYFPLELCRKLVPTVVQQLTRFRLVQRVARSVCGSRTSCSSWLITPCICKQRIGAVSVLGSKALTQHSSTTGQPVNSGFTKNNRAQSVEWNTVLSTRA